jgi:lysophospholipase L1-like esterase
VAAKKLGAKLVNLAVGGATCEQVLSNQVPNIPVDATFITIDCGTNDFDHDLKDAPIHDRVIDAAHQRAPSARLIIVLLHGVGYAPLNAHLREVAANYGAPVVDPNTITNVMDWPAPPGGIGLHPNAEAARIIGEAVAEGVTGTRDSRLSGKFP